MMTVDTLFQEFMPKCVGKTMDRAREKRLEIQKNIERKKPVYFSYRPAKEYQDPPESKYNFPNSSGNPIRNPKNLRLTDVVPDEVLKQKKSRTR